MGKHVEPGHDAGKDGKDEEDDGDGPLDDLGGLGRGGRRLVGDHRQDDADAGDRDHRRNRVTAEPCRELCDDRFGQHRLGHGRDLRVQPRLRLAHVVAAAVERTAERADRRRIGRAPGHVLRFERMLADRAGDLAFGEPALARLAGEIEFPFRPPGDQRRDDESRDERDIGGERGGDFARCAEMRDEGEERRHAHGAEADGVDVVEMGALELDSGRGEPERLVDEEIGGDRREPGHGDDRKDAERLLQQTIDAELHQQERDRHVEHQPDDAARMAVGEPREEVRPGERARIGVHHVDLELRDDDEGGHQQERGRARREDVAEGGVIHLRRVGGPGRGNAGAERQHDEKGAGKQLRRADDHPTGAGKKDGDAVPELALAVRRQEAQEVHLFADLRHQREDDRRGSAEFDEMERRERAGGTRCVMDARISEPQADLLPVGKRDEGEGKNVQDDPEGLRDELEPADQLHAMGDQRDHHDGADDVADPERYAERELQRPGHDRGFDREEDEGEARIDQRGDRRADIAEARAAREKVDVDAVTDGIAADRQADDKDHQARDEDRDDGVGRAVGHGNGAADGFQRQEGDGADRRLRNARGGKAPRALGGKAQRIVLERLVGDPAVIFSSNGNDALACRHGPSSSRNAGRMRQLLMS